MASSNPGISRRRGTEDNFESTRRTLATGSAYDIRRNVQKRELWSTDRRTGQAAPGPARPSGDSLTRRVHICSSVCLRVAANNSASDCHTGRAMRGRTEPCQCPAPDVHPRLGWPAAAHWREASAAAWERRGTNKIAPLRVRHSI